MALVWIFAACAGSPAARVAPPVAAQSEPDPTREFAPDPLQELQALKDPAAMRAHLAAGLSDRDLHYVGFDQVSLGDSIAGVVEAVVATIERDRDAAALQRFADRFNLYCDVRRDWQVSRTAGAASCIADGR